ncbi:BMP family ABC transporter substrate-binding protein [Candidatus Poribacteria bacterium]|nr:BMP family ABC transporter substrate-binding protein [Candidatus Poribacteria bacterium]
MKKKWRLLIPIFLTCLIIIETTPAAIKVGLIYDVRGRGDLSFCDAAYTGAKKATDKWDIKLTEVNPGQSTDTEITLRRLAKLKYDLIIGVGFLFREPMNRVAVDYPNVNFALIDAEAEPDNVASLIYKAHEGTFLAGVIAALKTDTKKVGFVGGMKIPLVEAFEIGFAAGIKATNPEIELLVNYVGVTPQAFDDPAKGKELALAQYNKGVDIIIAAAGASGLGALEAAKQTNKYIIWVDSNGNGLIPGQVLTSIIKGVELSVYQMIENVVSGTFTGGLKNYGLKEGGIEYIVDEDNKTLLSEDILKKVEEFKAKIIAEEIVVPHLRSQTKSTEKKRK